VTGLEGGHDDPDTVVGALPSYLADRFPERESVIAGAEAVLELTVRQLGVA
jgi:hypothetical protein